MRDTPAPFGRPRLSGFVDPGPMSEFVEHLHEVFSEFGRIDARRMFGGHGIFHDGLMFALVADDTLYLKADDESAGCFESQGRERFQYNKGGRVVAMSYFEAVAS